MNARTTMCILFHDEVVDVVFIDRTVLGTQIRFMEQLSRDNLIFEEAARLMKSVEKTPARVLLCPPRDMVMQRTLTYPALAEPEIAGMVQFEATRHVPLDEKDRALAWSAVTLEGEKKLLLNLVAARKSELRELIGRFESAGVPIDEAAPFSSAVVSALAGQPTLMIDTDENHVELCLYGNGQLRDSQILAADTPGFSSGRVVAAARQMAAKNRSWLGMEGVGRVVSIGPRQLSEAFNADLGAAFGLSVKPLLVPENLYSGDSAFLAEAVLAAMTELPREMNLSEHSDRKVPLSRKTIVVASLCALLAIELLGWAVFRTMAPGMQRKEVAAEIAKMRRRAAPIQRMKDRNREMRAQLYRLEDICGSHVTAMQVLLELSELLPTETYLNVVQLREGSLTIRGSSKEPDRLPEIMMGSPYVEAISKTDIGKKEGDYHTISMTVTLRSSDEETDS